MFWYGRLLSLLHALLSDIQTQSTYSRRVPETLEGSLHDQVLQDGVS